MHNNAFLKLAKNPLQLRLFLLKMLPAALFAGVRVQHASATACAVSVPYKWFTRNPFGSTYFACLAMAAEMSTGILAMAQVFRRKPRVLLLVTAVESKYLKKATGKTTFVCNDGWLLEAAVAQAIQSKEAQTVRAAALGYNKDEELVAEFWITWSFKVKEA